jgi:two-component system nitrogen regulation response regulator NtrX
MQIFGFDKKPLIGVDETQKGKLDLVGGGTLYLKEISYLNKDSIAKITKLLETKTFHRVGSQETIHSDVRLVASTTQSLDPKVAALFSATPLSVPALKDRKEDIPVLVQHFSDIYANESGTRAKNMTDDALDNLTSYVWPGNVRELKNFIERVYILVEKDEIESKDLAESGLIMDSDQGAITASNLKIARAIFEKQYILKKLEENKGNVSKTAEMIGLERSHLHRKMKTYGIET